MRNEGIHLDALFEVEGTRVRPSTHAIGPWGASLHGGAAAGLFAWQFEQMGDGSGLHLARLAVEIFKPVPVQELTLDARFSREGRRVRFAEAELSAGGEVLTRATATWIRDEAMALPERAIEGSPMDGVVGPAPDDVPRWAASGMGPFMEMMDFRVVMGGFKLPGAAAAWMRPTLPIVAGHVNSPTMAVAAVADCGNGLSSLASPEELAFINPDLTIALSRAPESDWVCMSSVTYPTDRGHGYAESQLADRYGRIGRAVQTLFLETRTPAGA